MLSSNEIVVVSLHSSEVLCIFDYYAGANKCVVSEKTNRHEKYIFDIAKEGRLIVMNLIK